MLVPIEVKFVIHKPYWFNHEHSGDPKRFFESLEKLEKVVLLRAIEDYCTQGQIADDRGHKEEWGDDPPCGGALLFKFKVKNTVYRFYALVHKHEDENRVVLVHGFKGHQGSRKEKDDPRAKANKKKAEERITLLIELSDCKGSVQ
jgi:hypothetical protein